MITHAAQWDNAIRTSPPGSAFVLEVPLRNLLTSMCAFVPCDRILRSQVFLLLHTVYRKSLTEDDLQ